MEFLAYSLSLVIFKEVVTIKTNMGTEEFFTRGNCFLELPINLPRSSKTLFSPSD